MKVSGMKCLTCKIHRKFTSGLWEVIDSFASDVTSFIMDAYDRYSFKPLPLRICGIHFSILDSRVLDCLGAEKWRM